MAKIARATMKIFGSSAGANQIAQFGSLNAGSPTFTTNVTTIQALSNYLVGWYNAVIGGNSPAIEDMNALFYLYAYQLAYLFQTGIAEWDSGTTYYTGSLVNDGLGNIYTSLLDTNLNNALTNTTYWRASYQSSLAQYNVNVGDANSVPQPTNTNLLGDAKASYAASTVTITIATPGVVSWATHPVLTGTPVYFTTTGALPTGLSANTRYYGIYVTTGTFRLATTLANALSGTAINTSVSQSGTHTAYAGGFVIQPGSQSNPMTTLGDLTYGGATSTGLAPAGSPVRLAGDTSNTRKFLRSLSVSSAATAPVWDTLVSGDLPLATPTAKGAITSYFPTAASSINSVSNADYTILTTDGYSTIEMLLTGTDRNVNLPAPASNTGRIITIKRMDGGAGYVFIVRNGSETIGGLATNNYLNAQYSYLTLRCDGTNWIVIGCYDSISTTSGIIAGVASGSWREVRSSIVPPGFWKLEAEINMLKGDNSTNPIGPNDFCLSTAAGNGGSFSSSCGYNSISIDCANIATIQASALTSVFVTVSNTSTTYYLNAKSVYTGTVPNWRGTVRGFRLS